VSGGADSLALLALAVAAGCDATAIHVDHGLRPGSADEADVVADIARRLGAAFEARTVRIEPGPNLEARARDARYAALPPDVATGHTADDQAETVLLNLLRGAGLDGLTGMGNGGEAGTRRRPILGLRRQQTHALCQELGLQPLTDPTNADPAFRRNRVRHELLPLLDDIAERDVAAVLARQAGLLTDEATLLDELASLLDPTDAKALAAAPPPLARRAVRRLLTAGQAHPPDAAAVERVLAVARGQATACEVAPGRRVARRRGRLSVGPAQGITFAAVDDPHVGPIVVGEDELQARIAELGNQISADYQGRAPLLVGVLKGAFVFMSDLARSISLPVEFDFMAVSSYGSATKTSGVVRIVKDLDLDLSGRHVLVVEDIVDSGLTLAYLRKNLLARNPASVEVCALLVKEGLQKTDPDLRYVGFRIPPEFVIGYGLDVDERYRNLPYICTFRPDGDS